MKQILILIILAACLVCNVSNAQTTCEKAYPPYVQVYLGLLTNESQFDSQLNYVLIMPVFNFEFVPYNSNVTLEEYNTLPAGNNTLTGAGLTVELGFVNGELEQNATLLFVAISSNDGSDIVPSVYFNGNNISVNTQIVFRVTNLPIVCSNSTAYSIPRNPTAFYDHGHSSRFSQTPNYFISQIPVVGPSVSSPSSAGFIDITAAANVADIAGKGSNEIGLDFFILCL